MKLNLNFFITMLAGILISACNSGNNTPSAENNKQDSTETVSVKVEKMPVLGSIEGDTINLYGKFVLFYGPAFTAESSDSVNEDIKSFLSTSKIILDSLKNSNGMYAGYTSMNSIRIYNLSNGKPMIILRSSFSEPTGLIISDGSQAPIIKKGPATVNDYHALIKKYFVQPS